MWLLNWLLDRASDVLDFFSNLYHNAKTILRDWWGRVLLVYMSWWGSIKWVFTSVWDRLVTLVGGWYSNLGKLASDWWWRVTQVFNSLWSCLLYTSPSPRD